MKSTEGDTKSEIDPEISPDLTTGNQAKPQPDSKSDSDSDSKIDRGASLVTGNLWRAIWIMSWPLLLTTIGNSVVGLTDVKVSSYLGASSQAAVGLAEQLLFTFMLFIMAVGVGTTALVSRAYGAKDDREMLLCSGQSFTLSIFLGFILAALCGLTAQFGLPLFATSKEVAVIGQAYLSAYSWMLIPFSITVIANSSFRAIGDSKTPLYIVTTMTIINVVGDFVTVLGGWPVPGLGVVGMAYAALAASLTGAILAIFFLRRSILKDSLVQILPPDFKVIKRITDIGLPSAFQRLSWAMSVFVVFFILAKCNNATAALASWTIGMRVESVIFMPLMALSLAVSSIVGQSLGAHENDRAFKAGWRVTSIGIWMMVVMSTLMYIFAGEIAGFLARDASTIAYTIGYLRINCLAEPSLALAQVLSGALQGAGDTKPVMWYSIACNWIVRMPLAYAATLLFHQGPEGVWWGMSLSIVLQGFLVMWRYNSKRWIQIKI